MTIQLMVNWWFGAQWFGALESGWPISNTPLHKAKNTEKHVMPSTKRRINVAITPLKLNMDTQNYGLENVYPI